MLKERQLMYLARIQSVSMKNVCLQNFNQEQDDDYDRWPEKLPPPRVVELLGKTVTIRCPKVPNARYTFQWSKSKLLTPSWKDADDGAEIKSPGKHKHTDTNKVELML